MGLWKYKSGQSDSHVMLVCAVGSTANVGSRSGATPHRVRIQTIDVNWREPGLVAAKRSDHLNPVICRGQSTERLVRIMAPIDFSTASCRGLASPFTPAIMSRHPSPGPSSQPAQPPPSISARQKPPKPYPIGIAAGAEDVKYQTKYKELKRKVKDIESVRLHVRVL